MTPARRRAEEPSLFAEPDRGQAGVPGEPGAHAPLAARMRPRSLDELVGQRHLLEPASVLRALITDDRLRSVILFGPPGTGKTSIASLIARSTKAAFVQLSAVTSGVADVRKVVAEGRERLGVSGRRTVLFIDEVHRFNKGQQDALLPGVEDGSIVFVGATTENPFFSIVGPLLSRSILFRLEPLDPEDVEALLRRAIVSEHGLGGSIAVEEDAIGELAGRAEGDARVALNAVEAAAETVRAREETTVTRADIDQALRERYVRSDRAGDQHFDRISAFIKSLRGSDPDAALAWLARMIKAGEDPRFIARRMVILASEDVGLAHPQALQTVVAAAHAVEMVGMPEAQLNLAQAALELALAPKSNAVTRALGAALRDVEDIGGGAVPEHLKNVPTPGRPRQEAEGYKYAHDFPSGWVEQRYMPEGFEDRTYWKPEADLDERRRRGRGGPPREGEQT